MPTLNYGNAVAIDGGELNLFASVDGKEMCLNPSIDGREAGTFYERGGSKDYNTLANKPKINGVTLVDDKSFEELGVDTLTNLEILSIFNRVFGG